MIDRLTAWLNIYKKEVGLFLWTLILLFLVRGSGIILNNYAETAFLKRYGVEFMPVVIMINAAVTMVIMGVMTGLIHRFPGPGLLAAMFLFCGGSVFGLRLLIPSGIDLVYPLLFILKALYELLIAMLFWNLANDLFNTRQSKRLFPLISAGGVLGQILGSFGTPLLASWLMLDNLLTVYLVVSVGGAAVVKAMMDRYPALMKPASVQKDQKDRTDMVKEIRRIWPLIKQSTMLRIMILLIFMPNVVIPIINYQFNYAVDSRFVTEAGILEFFSYFRGVLNIVNLIILLFVGRIYGRWGLSVALMFHPLNYLLAFAAFLFRFDVASAVYARMSTNVIRTTINIPTQAVLMGLFPDDFRSLVRPFLRGTVVRVALFFGSGLVLLSTHLFHPRYLSLVALPFVLMWILGPVLLKRRYASILLDLVKRDQLDIRSMEEKDIGQLFRDRRIQEQLSRDFQRAEERDVVWYAHLLRRSHVKGTDALIMRRLPELPPERQIALIEILAHPPDPEEMFFLKHLAEEGPAERTLAVLNFANRFPSETWLFLDRTRYLHHPDPRVRASALAGLFKLTPQAYAPTIERWLASSIPNLRLAAVLAAGETGNRAFAPALVSILRQTDHPDLLAAIIKALDVIGLKDLNDTVGPFMTHPHEKVRQAAVASFHIFDKSSLTTAMALLADRDAQVRHAALERIAEATFVDGKTLITALQRPDRNMRHAVFELIERLDIKNLDIYRFAQGRIEGAYKYLAEQQAVARLPATPARDLLSHHLHEQSQELVKEVLRVLEYTDPSGRMRIVHQGLSSGNARQRANSQEALNDLLDRRLATILLPLVDRENPGQALKSVQGRIDLLVFEDNASLLRHLLSRDEWLTVLLTLASLAGEKELTVDRAQLHKLENHDNLHVRQQACRLLAGGQSGTSAEELPMAPEHSLPDVLLRLKRIEIFESLTISQLAAIAAVTEEIDFDENATVINEGDEGDTLYLVLEGKVAVIKRQGETEVELDQIEAGDYFGEMALFGVPRTATIRTLTPCRMLYLHKHAFDEMVKEYPQIALEICKVLSKRIRTLHQFIANRT